MRLKNIREGRFDAPTTQSGPDLYGARETIKNALSQMRNDPARTLANGLDVGLKKAAGNQQAMSIIRNMQSIATQFFNQIRKFGILQNSMQGTSRPRMPNQGEPGFEEYQQVYTYYQEQLYHLWDQLDKLAHPA